MKHLHSAAGVLESVSQATREAGVFGGLVVAGGGLAALLAVITVILTAAKRSNAAQYASASCLLGALALLGLGEVGFLAGMSQASRALPSREWRVNLLLALVAAALPLLAGFAGVVVARVRVGVLLGIATGAIWAAVFVQHSWPLPGPMVAAPRGIQLPHSVAPTPLDAAALVAVTADALWVNGAQVERALFAKALSEGIVRERNPSVLPLMVDEGVTFSTLAEALAAAGEANRHEFSLVVLSNDGALRMIRFRDPRATAPAAGPDVQLTVLIDPEGFRITLMGSALDPMGLDWEKLSSKLAEVKEVVPENRTVRVTAEPEVTVAQLVKTLDALSRRNGELLNADLVVGELPAP